MATITRTASLAPDQLVANTDIHNLIDTATVTAITRGDLDTTAAIVTVTSSNPSSPKQGELVFRTDPANNQGVLLVYDGHDFRPLVECAYAFNPSASTILAGSIVQIDTDAGNIRLSDMALPISITSQASSIPLGIVLTDIAATSFGFVVTRGKVYNVRKTAPVVTIGQAVVPTAGAGNEGKASGNNSFGGSSIGLWLENTSATTATAYLFGTHPSSYVVTRTTATLLLATSPATLGMWSGSYATPVVFVWPIDNAGTKAHLIELHAIYGPAETLSMPIDLCVAIRPTGAGGTSTDLTLWPMVMGQVPTTSWPTGLTFGFPLRRLVTQMILPHSTGTSTQAEFHVRASTVIGTNASVNLLRLEFWDRGHIAGGAVL